MATSCGSMPKGGGKAKPFGKGGKLTGGKR